MVILRDLGMAVLRITNVIIIVIINLHYNIEKIVLYTHIVTFFELENFKKKKRYNSLF